MIECTTLKNMKKVIGRSISTEGTVDNDNSLRLTLFIEFVYHSVMPFYAPQIYGQEAYCFFPCLCLSVCVCVSVCLSFRNFNIAIVFEQQ